LLVATEASGGEIAYGDEAAIAVDPFATLDPSLASPEESATLADQLRVANEYFGPAVWRPLKGANLKTAWLPSDDLGFFDLELAKRWTIPTGLPFSHVAFTPTAAIHLLDGPTGFGTPDLPEQLYDLSVDIKWLQPLSTEFAFELGITPGVFTDFEQSSSDAFRMGARAIGFITYSPQTRFVLGLAYLDRDDVNYLPVTGMVWTPSEDARFELVFPRPKIAWRRPTFGSSQEWFYLTGEFGGGSWAVRRESGADDVANYYDLRLAVGWERTTPLGPKAFVEIGYAFNRRLEFRSPTPIFEPDNALLLRATVSF